MTTVSTGTAQIAETVAQGGGLVVMSLGDLRDALGYSRLGKHVLTNMESHLTDNGLGFFPLESLDPIVNAEPRQWQEIHVFVNEDTPRCRVFRAIADPENYSLTEALDEFAASVPPSDEPNYSAMSAAARLALIDKIAKAEKPVRKTAAKAPAKRVAKKAATAA